MEAGLRFQIVPALMGFGVGFITAVKVGRAITVRCSDGSLGTKTAKQAEHEADANAGSIYEIT
jgi:hypothetical protein